MKKFKNAFSMAEVLIVMAIISVLVVMGLSYFNKKDLSVRYLYGNTLHSLDRAFYNMFVVDGINIFDAKTYPVYGSTDNGAKALCEGLTKYINVVGEPNCSSKNLVSDMANNFPENCIQFKTVNGVDFYISRKSQDNTFYLVFADLNGHENGPNSAKYAAEVLDTNGKTVKAEEIPDIHAFAFLTLGRVIPIGPAEITTSIMQTRLTYVIEVDDEEFIEYSSEKLPYYATKAKAWGYYTDKLTNNDYDKTDIYEPYASNDAVRSNISQGSVLLEVVSDYQSLIDKNNGQYTMDVNHCGSEKLNFNKCGVNIDRYK